MNTLTLKDGYGISWDEYGLSDGVPIVYFHGSPGSSLEPQTAQDTITHNGARVIAVNRPGFASSSYVERASVAEWVNDLHELLQHLGIKQTHLLGFSGGSAFAAAYAANYPNHSLTLTIAGGVSPFDLPALREAMNPGFLALFDLAANDYDAALAQVEQMAPDGETLKQVVQAGLPEPDLHLFTTEPYASSYLAVLTASLAQGVRGIVQDMRLLASNWGFDPQCVNCPVNVLHGSEDLNVKVSMAHFLNDYYANAELTILEGKGHLFLLDHWQPVLARIVQPDFSASDSAAEV